MVVAPPPFERRLSERRRRRRVIRHPPLWLDAGDVFREALSDWTFFFGLVRGLDQGKGAIGDKEGAVVHIQYMIIATRDMDMNGAPTRARVYACISVISDQAAVTSES